MTTHQGGCLCGMLRYQTTADPLRVTVCHCRFCQRATGSAYMVEPIFQRDAVGVVSGEPRIYETRSAGSGRMVRIHFCSACGTKIYLSFERFPEVIGVYAGTFDDPEWFEIAPGNARHIFLESARHDTVIPAGFDSFHAHAIDAEGRPLQPRRFDTPTQVPRRP